MNSKKNQSTSKSIWNIFSKIAGYTAILSFFAFFCLKIELFNRLPQLTSMLFSASTQDALGKLNANYFLVASLLAMLFSPSFKKEVITPLSQYSIRDLFATSMALAYLGAAIYVAKVFKRYTVQDWEKLFSTNRGLSFLFSFAYIKNNILFILVGILIILGIAFFSASSFFKEQFYQPMKSSFKELRYFSWPNKILVLRYAGAICIVTLFVALLIACLDWAALRFMTFILSWTARND